MIFFSVFFEVSAEETKKLGTISLQLSEVECKLQVISQDQLDRQLGKKRSKPLNVVTQLKSCIVSKTIANHNILYVISCKGCIA